MPAAQVSIELLAERPEFVPTLAEWLLREWPASVDHSPAAAALVVHGRASWDRLPLGLVAVARDQAVGAVTLVFDRPPAPTGATPVYVPCLAGLYVPETHRRQGIGAALCGRAAEEARRLRLPGLFLYTRDRASFYTRLGWSILEPGPPTFMRRDLSAE